MLGFHSFSENPFSALTGDIGATKTGSALLNASSELLSSGSQYISGLSLLSSSGELSSAATLYISAANALENSGTLTANGSLVVPGASLLLDAGTVTANGTLIHGAISAIEGSGTIGANSTLGANGAIVNLNSGTLTANGTLQVAGTSALEGSGTLSSNGTMAVDGASLLLDTGTLSANGTLIHAADSTLQASGTIGVAGSAAVAGATLELNSGTVTANGTLQFAGSTLLENSGELTSSGVVFRAGKSAITSSGEISATPQLTILGSSTLEGSGTLVSGPALTTVSSTLLLNAGTLTPNGTLIHGVESALEGSGTFDSSAILLKHGESTLSASGTLAVDGSLAISAIYDIESSGTIGANASSIVSASTVILSNGELASYATLAGSFVCSQTGVCTITGQIGKTVPAEAVVGTTYAEFLKSTRRLSYKPALTRLSSKDQSIALDFAFNEGAGNLRSTSSRNQIGNIGNLSWGRVDGRQSLTSTGISYQNNRIAVSTDGIVLDKNTIFMSFKPSVINTVKFLVNLRGTDNNNNEIDLYIANSGKIIVSIYDGTTLQNITTTNNYVQLNEWNTLALTWDTTLTLYVNDKAPLSLTSFVEPSVLGQTLYIGGRVENNGAFAGSIDHFRWYNRELNSSEVANLSKNITQSYTFNSLVPNYYNMSNLTGLARIVNNGSTSLSSNGIISAHGSFLIANLKSSFGGVGEIIANGIATEFTTSAARLSAAANLLANGVILGELDVVPFTVFINRLEQYDGNVYQRFVQEFNVARSKIISASIEQNKIQNINIDTVLDRVLEK